MSWKHPTAEDHARWQARMIERLTPGPGGCLLWSGALDSQGYGRVAYPGLSPLAHRALYVLTLGPVPDDRQLDHRCRRRSCCNVEHLEPVTPKVNTNRGISAVVTRARWATRSACANGHTYTTATTRIDPAGTRHCRVCDDEHQRRRSERRALARVERFGYDPGPLSRRQPTSN